MKTPGSAEGESDGLAGASLEIGEADADDEGGDTDIGGDAVVEPGVGPDEDAVGGAAIGGESEDCIGVGDNTDDGVGILSDVGATVTVWVTVEPGAEDGIGWLG